MHTRHLNLNSSDTDMGLFFLIRSSLATILFLFAATASGAEDCSKLTDAEARLSCFDALYPSQDEKADDVVSENILRPIKKRGFFEIEGKQYYEGTIVEMLNKPQQRMVFRFDNDEIWIQTTPRSLPIKVGDKVTIRRGTVGGYVLRTENKVSTKISQITTD